MSWQDRVQPQITLTSPSGLEFTALWRGDRVTIDKRVAEFNYPNIVGTATQDHAPKSEKMPITFYFDGENHDLISNSFQLAIKESGPWTIIHPTRGQLLLQPTRIQIKNAPLDDGDYTQIDSEWIEKIDDSNFQSPEELAGKIKQVYDDVSQLSTESFADQVKSRLGIITETRNVIAKATAPLRTLARQIAEINSEFESVSRGLVQTLEQPVVDSIAVAGGIRNLFTLPALVTRDAQSRYNTYSGIIEDIFSEFTPQVNDESVTSSLVLDTTSTAILLAMADIALTSEFETRQQALDAAEMHSTIYFDLVNRLDAIQEFYKDSDLTKKYFSQILSFSDVTLMTFLAIRYLIDTAWSLAIEKTIVLETPRSPIEITMTEYGSLGENDSNFDLFILSNDLSHDEIYELPAGREIVIYIPQGA